MVDRWTFCVVVILEKFCVPRKIHRKRIVQFLETIMNGLGKIRFTCPFRYCIIFSVFTVFQQIAYFNIDISYFLFSHIFF